jgi:methyl-accepting chemotaxis protein
MKKSAMLFWAMPFVLIACLVQVQAAQDTTKTAKKLAADTTAKIAPPAQYAADERPLPSLRKPKLKSEEINTVEKMQQEAARLREEAKVLHDMADTLNRASDEAEKKADEANDKAEKLEDDLKEHGAHYVAGHVKLEMERLKRIIEADIERIKRLHGATTAKDSLYMLQADSLDSILAHVSIDSAGTMEKQKKLLDEIHANSGALLEKSKDMSVKAREMEEAADSREDMADDLTEKARSSPKNRTRCRCPYAIPCTSGSSSVSRR